MWKRDFPSIYTAIKDQWSPAIQPIITALQGDREIDVIKLLLGPKNKRNLNIM